MFACCGCTLFVLTLSGLYLIVDREISLIPTPTIDLACEDTICLNACMSRMPNFDIPRLGEHRYELSEEPMGYELARYRLEPDGSLKRVAAPSVPDYLKPYQENIQLHQRIWDYFTGIYPHDQFIHPSYMVIYMNNETQHFTASVEDLDGKWSLSVNLIDLVSTETVIRTLTHEYGHMLTLNSTEVRDAKVPFNWSMNRKEFDKMLDSCGGSFFTGWQCANRTSYLNEFGNRFWMGEVYESWVDVFLPPAEAAPTKRAEMDAFYTKYAAQFVTPYAATNSVEDIAESWTEFILQPKPSGQSIADQKILYFYEHSELVELRGAILRNVCQYAQDQK
jgi:hypothetical protein